MRTLIELVAVAVLSSVVTACICSIGWRRKVRRTYEEAIEARESTAVFAALTEEEKLTPLGEFSAYSEDGVYEDDTMVGTVAADAYIPPAAYRSAVPTDHTAEVTRFCEDMDADTAFYLAGLQTRMVGTLNSFSMRLHDVDSTDQMPAVILRETTTETVREVMLNGAR